MVEKKQLKDVTQKKKKAKPASEKRTQLKDVTKKKIQSGNSPIKAVQTTPFFQNTLVFFQKASKMTYMTAL